MAKRGRLQVVSLLLEHGASVESRTDTDGTPLVWACMGGDADVVRHLLERGANINGITKGKGTALHHAATYGHAVVASVLLKRGASPDARDNRGQRPGDKFDAEVADSVRRVILKDLAKARARRSSGRRSHAFRERPPNRIGKDRDRSASLADGRTDEANETADLSNDPDSADSDDIQPSGASIIAPACIRETVIDPAETIESDNLSAAEAAAAAAAWTPTSPNKHPRPYHRHTTQLSPIPDVDYVGESSDEDSDEGVRRAKLGDGESVTLGERSSVATADAHRRRIAATPPGENTDSEPCHLRRQLAELSAAASTAADHDSAARTSLQTAVAEANARHEEARAADNARVALLESLVQTLDARLATKGEENEHLRKELRERSTRLRQEENEGTALRRRVGELERGMSVLRACLVKLPKTSLSPVSDRSSDERKGAFVAPGLPIDSKNSPSEGRSFGNGGSEALSTSAARRGATASPVSNGPSTEPCLPTDGKAKSNGLKSIDGKLDSSVNSDSGADISPSITQAPLRGTQGHYALPTYRRRSVGMDTWNGRPGTLPSEDQEQLGNFYSLIARR